MKRNNIIPKRPLLPDRVKQSPSVLINEISQLLRSRFRENEGEMSQESVRLIIINLSNKDGVTQLSLVKETHLRPSTVSVALARLEKLGYIRRETDRYDMRVFRVFLTEKGRELYTNYFEKLRDVHEVLVNGITGEEILALTTLLTKMRDNMLEDSDIISDRGEM